MWAYISLGIVWVGLLIPVIRERQAWIACAHGGTGLFFTSLFLSLGLDQTGDIADIVWLKIIGCIFFISAAILIISAVIAVARGSLVKSGISGIVRHPMYLGTALAAFALMLVFQSILSIVLGIIAIAFLWMASTLEDAYNIERFGDNYRKYMKSVPRWNVFQGLQRK
jgi:protein-S-isoprenylcysteine O-methyltransferase Ste14